jgi:hypothetical protein
MPIRWSYGLFFLISLLLPFRNACTLVVHVFISFLSTPECTYEYSYVHLGIVFFILFYPLRIHVRLFVRVFG